MREPLTGQQFRNILLEPKREITLTESETPNWKLNPEGLSLAVGVFLGGRGCL
jgi:hypothetical protein